MVRLLHLNPPQNALRQSGDDEHYKVLVLDTFTKAVIAPLLRVNELRCLAIVLQNANLGVFAHEEFFGASLII